MEGLKGKVEKKILKKCGSYIYSSSYGIKPISKVPFLKASVPNSKQIRDHGEINENVIFISYASLALASQNKIFVLAFEIMELLN